MSYYKEELELVDEAVAAPQRPFKVSFVKDKQSDSQSGGGQSGAGLLLKDWTGEADRKR